MFGIQLYFSFRYGASANAGRQPKSRSSAAKKARARNSTGRTTIGR
jgi:hypothetical protein